MNNIRQQSFTLGSANIISDSINAFGPISLTKALLAQILLVQVLPILAHPI